MGFVYPKINYLFVTSVTMSAAAAFSYLMGIMQNLYGLLVLALLNLGLLGFFEAGCQIFLLQTWGKEAMPFIQVTYFMFGVGAMAAPLISEPFLTNHEGEDERNRESSHLQHSPSSGPLAVQYAYAIVAGNFVFCSLVAMISWWKTPPLSQHPSRQTNNSNTNGKKEVSPFWKTVVVTLHLIFVHVYAGIEIGVGSFLVTFAYQSGLHLSKQRASYMTTMFWTLFTVMKLGALLVIPIIGNGNNILLGIGITTVGSAIIVPYGATDETMLWIGIGLVGFGISSIFACALRYLEGFFPVTSMIGAMNSFMFISGEFTFPFLISAFIEDEPRIMPWVVMGCTIVMIITYPIIMLLCNTKLKQER